VVVLCQLPGSLLMEGYWAVKPMFEVETTLKSNAKRSGRVFICLLFCAFCCPSAQSQVLSTDDVVRELAPKPPTRTRSISSPASIGDPDDASLQSLPGRGIRVTERKKLQELIASKNLPTLDIEILFNLDSALIPASATQGLNQIGGALQRKELASSRIAINGHTDASGDDEYNQQLSERRALSVRDFLIDRFKVDPSRLVVAGFGEERLKNRSDPVSAINRRVELVNLSSE
jgi:outer membrane protein OmpA-like peptidoglycan-associated protein